MDGLAIALAGWTLWTHTVPFPDLELRLTILAAWLVAGIAWLIRTGRVVRKARKGLGSIRHHMFRVLLIPGLLVVTVGALWSDVLWEPRLQRSLPTLERAAEQALRDHQDAPRVGDRIGPYEVEHVTITPGVVHLGLDGFNSGFLACCGLAYSPAGRPADTLIGNEGYSYREHLGGHWYSFCHYW